MSEPRVHCNCAHIPPTMPTARTEHLVDCPVAIYTALQDKERMRADHAEIAALMKNDDVSEERNEAMTTTAGSSDTGRSPFDAATEAGARALFHMDMGEDARWEDEPETSRGVAFGKARYREEAHEVLKAAADERRPIEARRAHAVTEADELLRRALDGGEVDADEATRVRGLLAEWRRRQL